MKLFRIFYTFIIILFVFIGNIGVNVYTHSCEEDGEFHSLLVKINHNCGGEDNKSSCCNETQEESGCCKDDVNFFKVKFDYFEISNIQISSSPLFLSPNFKSGIIVAFQELKIQRICPTRPPPKPSGQELLCLNQVFRV